MKKILIIDDDHDLLYIMSRWVTNLGNCMVKIVDNGPQAKNLILKQAWDLIITDVYLNECTGLEIARLVKKVNPKCQILMVSGYANTDISISALNMHVQAFLLKPLNKRDFLNKIIELLNKANCTGTRKRILAIGAHPDDVEIGCGGTLLRHKAENDDICILTLTNGEKGGQSDMRSLESKKASKIINAHLILGNLIDTKVTHGSKTIKVIERVVQQYKPDIIYTHSNHDAHQDHSNCYKATLVAARLVENLECYQSPSSTVNFKPTRFSDITQQLKQKLELIKCYASQYEKCRYLKQSLISSTAEYWGRFSTYGMVEPFEVIWSV
jgi:LmbE family N-acetylglucosaminyl deacetylase